jgi:hypothetical protein
MSCRGAIVVTATELSRLSWSMIVVSNGQRALNSWAIAIDVNGDPAQHDGTNSKRIVPAP